MQSTNVVSYIDTYYDFYFYKPRLAFGSSHDPGEYVRHFVAYFSRDGRKLTLIDPPHNIGETIGGRMRVALPHKIASDKAVDNGIYTIALRSSHFGCQHYFLTSCNQLILTVC